MCQSIHKTHPNIKNATPARLRGCRTCQLRVRATRPLSLALSSTTWPDHRISLCLAISAEVWPGKQPCARVTSSAASHARRSAVFCVGKRFTDTLAHFVQRRFRVKGPVFSQGNIFFASLTQFRVKPHGWSISRHKGILYSKWTSQVHVGGSREASGAAGCDFPQQSAANCAGFERSRMRRTVFSKCPQRGTRWECLWAEWR